MTKSLKPVFTITNRITAGLTLIANKVAWFDLLWMRTGHVCAGAIPLDQKTH